MKYVDIYCIGVSDSSHIGAWAALLRYKGYEKIIRGKIENTNEIRATMIAVIKGLECLKEPCNVTVYTQLDFIPKAFELGWRRRSNLDLWHRIDELDEIHSVKYKWYTKIATVFVTADKKRGENV